MVEEYKPYTLATEATSSVMTGAGGDAGTSVGTAGGVTFLVSSELSVVVSWATLFSTGASGSRVLCKTHTYACSLEDTICE